MMLLNRIFQINSNKFIVLNSNHFISLVIQQKLNRLYSHSTGKHSIKTTWRTTSLHMP